MKDIITQAVADATQSDVDMVAKAIEIPPSADLGDFALPCFIFAKQLKKAPPIIAQELVEQLHINHVDRIEAKGPYLNFFVNPQYLAEQILQKTGAVEQAAHPLRYALDLSAPNISKHFGIGHLRSTIIGNAIANIAQKAGHQVTRINYVGDWGTPHGKIIAGYLDFGDEEEFNKDPISHLYWIYQKVSKDETYDQKGRDYFKKLEDGDPEATRLWKLFREKSLEEFDAIYKMLDVEFDVTMGESEHEDQLENVFSQLQEKNLLTQSDGAQIIDLEEYKLGVAVIKKSDGAHLYLTRDIAVALFRKETYEADQLLYEVGQEQQLHFKQLFKILELMGYDWAKQCSHISHGLYLDKDGKKFATRKGKSVLMIDVLEETIDIARSEIVKRHENLSEQEIGERALLLARAAILFGDLKNYRENNMVFDIDAFTSFEGDTGPYVLYSYARARSIATKSEVEPKADVSEHLVPADIGLIKKIGSFNDVVHKAHKDYNPAHIAHYCLGMAQAFTDFYHTTKVIGAPDEAFRLYLINAYCAVLKDALGLLGISTLESM